ncbi:hypothetical protein LL06_20155 [Hoeflea sp. BAL378]|uniref:hypothetical protein n=1 Tax=Hoeflea sp. BAL378 TaxID=1547437 RepID=UPI000512C0D9|nr:hypothetical protein [Hoeflea sp. BAL378]KGF67812.1 hypothetical protein LL06_20155 [Hoeflea sp. BAL378]
MRKTPDGKAGTHKKAMPLLLASMQMPLETADEAVSLDTENALKRAVARITALDRDCTAHAFELGETFAELKSLVPQKSFGKFLSTFSNYSVCNAWNYSSVYERLQDHRDQLIASAVAPTVMFEIAKGDKDQIDGLVARIATGERLKGKDVKAALGGSTKLESDVSALDVGGLAGLRKAAEIKLGSDLKEFESLVKDILAHVDSAVETSAIGKRVVKSKLADSIEIPSRHAHDLFKVILAPIERHSWNPKGNLEIGKVEDGTSWGEIQRLLRQLGGAEGWPAATELNNWLAHEVIPALRFVVHGEPMATQPSDDNDDENLISYDQLPEHVAKIVEKALHVIEPEHRAKTAESIYLDPRPNKSAAA